MDRKQLEQENRLLKAALFVARLKELREDCEYYEALEANGHQEIEDHESHWLLSEDY